ncbi:MAG: ABC transporter permease [Rickettsiales bacterium]|nr:ABC transporter permease [Rickettsiales bacterium]
MNYMMNLIGFKTILKKEIMRILRIWPQTLIPPIITTSLYFIIFGEILFKDRFIFVDGQEISYSQYLIPGLVAMAIIINSYSSTSSSFFSIKFQKNIEELLVSPLPAWIIILGYTFGGLFRGLTNGLMIFITSLCFEPTSIHSYLMCFSIALLMSFFFSIAGIINAIFSKSFDDIMWFPSFILTPMVYLGGVFFTIEMLPNFWQLVTKINPIYHFIDIFRHSLLGIGKFNYLSFIVIVIFNFMLFITAIYFFNKKLQK